MKKHKLWYLLMITILLTGLTCQSVLAKTESVHDTTVILHPGNGQITIVDNNVTSGKTLEVAPYIQDGFTFIPLSAVLETLGATTRWIPEARQVEVTTADTRILLTIDANIGLVNDRKVTLDKPAQIVNSRTQIPLRFVAENLGYVVKWYGTENKIEITNKTRAAADAGSDYGLERETVHQISILSALLEGQYDGLATFEELKKYGDTGIGTFEGLDGEMVELDGKYYQVKADGVAYPVADTQKTPFASVTYFEADKSQTVNEELNLEQLQNRLDRMTDNKNIFYAIKVTGDFKYVKTRSVPKQQKPYPPLAEVTKNQPTFELNNVKGTMVGFWCPSYVNGINVPGYHLHFLNADKNAGGHLLACTLVNGQIEIDATPNFYMSLPFNDEFGKIDMTEDRSQETNSVEK